MKSKIFMGVFLILILIANISFASYSTVTMEVVEEPVCTIPLGENSKFEKSLVDKDLKNKEVTLQLKVTNDEIASKPTGELILVLDDSNSMNDKVSENETRKDIIYKSAQNLISTLLKDNTNLKIGIVKFSTDGDVNKEGTMSDASVVSELSNDATALSNAISNIIAGGYRTDLQSGLLLAKQQFTQTATNKYMVVLTDGVPNVAINFDKNYYSQDVIDKTMAQLKDIEDSGIELITMLTGVDDNSYPTIVPEPDIPKTFKDFVDLIFGTETNPTAGTFYYISDNLIESTIMEDILNSLLPVEKTLKNIVIKDYFPEEIVKNFDFSYVSQANIGTVTAQINPTDNSITWTIPELESGKTATVQYKLKLKEDFDSAIVDKLLDTNEKVDVTYTDYEGENQTATSDVTPKLRLSEPPAVLPQTGTITLVGLGVLAIALVTFTSIKLISLYKKMN